HTPAGAPSTQQHPAPLPQVYLPKMANFQILVVLLVVAISIIPSTDAAPAPFPGFLFNKAFPRAMARARSNDRGAGSFAGRPGNRVGGAIFNPDPFAFPGNNPFPIAPILFRRR
ncbi:unnamed protein product, partial [Meganyctiphanes norvegica]